MVIVEDAVSGDDACELMSRGAREAHLEPWTYRKKAGSNMPASGTRQTYICF